MAAGDGAREACIVQLWLCPIWRLAGRWGVGGNGWVVRGENWFPRILGDGSGMVVCFYQSIPFLILKITAP